ncbi:MAG: FkbM family methyltransferase [Ignavibacteria bacterium]
MKELVNNLLNRLGFPPVHKYPIERLKRRKAIFDHYKIDLLYDIGANIGEYSMIMRKIGYDKRIVSFEPLSSAFRNLVKVQSADEHWDAYNFALGDFDGVTEINISENSVSSSILPVSQLHIDIHERTKVIGKEKVEVRKLDSIFDETYKGEKNIFLKIDTQEFEKKVLEGGKQTLKTVSGIQMELSIVPLYNENENYIDMIRYAEDYGFTLSGLEPGFYDKTSGKILQFDGIFTKSLTFV